MLPVRRLLLCVPLVGMLIAATATEARADLLTDPTGQILSLLKSVEFGLTNNWLEPADVKTMMTVWPGLLKDPGLIESTPPGPLATMRPDQADCLGNSIRFITLKEAIALALEGGPIDSQTLNEQNQHSSNQPSSIGTGLKSHVAPVAPCAHYTMRVDEHTFTCASTLPIRLEFERKVQLLRMNVEMAYWNLQYGYWNVYAQEQGIRFAYEAWKMAKSKYEAGRGTKADLVQAHGQYESFRALHLIALNDVFDQERFLRSMMGMQGILDDGKRLVPSDRPTLARVRPDWASAQEHALASRPEIIVGRQIAHLAKKMWIALKPLEQCFAIFGFTVAPEPEYPGRHHITLVSPPDPADSRNILAYAYEMLKYEEGKTTSYLIQQYRRVPLNYEMIRVQRATRESYAETMKEQLDNYTAGIVKLDELLETMRFWCNARSQEQLSIRDYNNALIQFEYATGSILERDPITIIEEAIPAWP